MKGIHTRGRERTVASPRHLRTRQTSAFITGPLDPLIAPPLCSSLLQDQDGCELGVAGSLEALSHAALSSQPVNSFDWSPDRLGLFVCSAFDQCLRVGIVTKLEKV